MTNGKPHIIDNENAMIVKYFIASTDIKLACTALVGPILSSLSAPFIKSYTSLAKLVPICINIAENIVRKKILRLNCDELNAIAEPTKTGAIDADNVFALIAMKTDFKKDVIKVDEEIS
tara:strand:- start:422 stop:778 length:357 start_codon:yes stop_codon:yes gene_type:complete